MNSRLLIAVSALFSSIGVHANDLVEFNVSGQAIYTQVKSAGVSFSPTLFQLKASAELTEGPLSGIGLQGMVSTPINDATKNNLTVNIKDQHGAYITLTDPEAEQGSIKVIVYIGYAATKLETEWDTGSMTDTFSGTSFGVTLQQRFSPTSPISWSVDCSRFYRDSNMRIDGCGLGANYVF